MSVPHHLEVLLAAGAGVAGSAPFMPSATLHGSSAYSYIADRLSLADLNHDH